MIGGPKHISGFSAVHQGKLYVILNYCTAFGYDVLGNVEDITAGGTAPTSTLYSFEKVRIEYANYTEPLGGSKKYQITFGSGATTAIDVDILGINRELIFLGYSHLGYAKDCSENIGYLQSAGSEIAITQTNVYGAYPTADPAGVFGYSSLWERTSTSELFGVESSYVSGVWAANGYVGGAADPENSGLQHVRFIAALDISVSDFVQNADSVLLFADALYGSSSYAAVAVFDWSVNLRSCKHPPQFTYDVCTDPGSPSYFEETEQDCDGNEIPSNFLSGFNIATFVDCCACAVNCSEVDAQLTIAPASTIYTTGSFAITVSGGTADYTYELIIPSGGQYLEDATPPTTSSTTHTFTNVPYTNEFGIYTVRVTDSAGCFREFKVRMPAGGRNPDDGGPPKGCTQSYALNYDPDAVVNDGSCIYCGKGAGGTGLIIDGQNQGDFIDGSTIVTDASSESTADGTLQYVGSVNPAVEPFLIPSTYTINVYNSVGNGQGYYGMPVQGANNLSSPTTTFSNLPTGWYAIVVEHTGSSSCEAVIWRYIGYEENEITCPVNVNWNVPDPCTGALIVTYDTEAEVEQVIFYNNSQTVLNAPIVVSEGDIVWINIIFAEGSGCNVFWENEQFGSSYFNCIIDPPPVIPGCMDPLSISFNPIATVDDGSCSYETLGCTDPSASNFNPTASIDNGSCVYGISGCMEPEATNYDPNATIPTGCVYACTEPIIGSIAVASNVPTITFINITTSYTVTWVNNETGASITTEDTATGPTLADGVYTVTVTNGNGCTEVDILGVNTTIVYGCMDTNADNYSPAANASNGDCNYSFVPSPCNPPEIGGVLTGLDACLSAKLNTYFNLMKAGRLSLCKTKVAEVLVLLKYLLGRKGLDCVFNCADSLSPTYSETIQGESCSTKWSEGGPSGESLIYTVNTVYVWGDVVKHPTSGAYYVYTFTSPPQSIYTPDPETVAGEVIWEYCREPLQFIDTTNRLDAYLAFVKSECKNCGIPGFTPIPPQIQTNPDVSDPTTEGGVRMTINGDNMEL
jgi:hypothetical protein